MYIVSEPKGLSEHHRHLLEVENAGLYPPAYIRFLQQYGEGTYRGWMNVQTPTRRCCGHLPNMGYGSMMKTVL